MRANEIAARLAQQADMVAEYLLPSGKREGSEWVIGNLHGDAGKSLKVRLSGDKTGVWRDFSADEGGDLLGLWMRVRDVGLSGAMREAKDYLGIHETSLERDSAPPALKQPKALMPLSDRATQWLEQDRGLSKSSIEAYRVMGSGTDVAFLSYVGPDVAWIKYRNPQDKSRMRVEKGGTAVLFGWQAIPEGSRSVVICEGEIDAMSWYDLGYPALSVPNGAQGLTWVETEYERLERFDELLIAFDTDEQGRKGAKALANRLGVERCRLVDTGIFKDGNELLLAGADGKQFVESAGWIDPVELRAAETFEDEVIRLHLSAEDGTDGFTSPFRKLDSHLRFRESELTIINGVNGHGKSQFVGQIVLHAAQDRRAVVASMELPGRRTMERMCRQASGSELTVPKIRSAMNWLTGRMWIFDLVGTAKVDRLLEVFEYAHRRYGITVFVIDSLLKCGISEDDYSGQKRFVERLADFKNQFPVHLFLVTHSRKSEDETKPTGKMDVRGSSSITDLADNVLIVWRNKAKEQKISNANLLGQQLASDVWEQPDAMMICEKQRNGEWEGRSKLWWHQASNQFLEDHDRIPTQYTSVRGV